MNKLVMNWYNIDWRKCYETVARMQHDIVVAYERGDTSRVKQLQHNLTNSFVARALAVRAVAVINKGKDIPGVDEAKTLTPKEKI